MGKFDALLKVKADKAAQKEVAKSRDRGADTKGRHLLGVKGGLDGVGRFRDSQGYSLARAAALALGGVDPRLCKEEQETHDFLQRMYAEKGFTPSSHRSLLVVADSNYLPVDTAEMRKFKSEHREKAMAAAPQGGVDWDHPGMRNIRQKALGITTATAGGSFVEGPQLGEMIELQRNFESFSRAGSREMTLPPNGRLQLPKQTGASTAYWVGEASGITDSTPATGLLDLQAKKLGVISTVTDEIMRFADPQIEAMVRYDQAYQGGLLADTAMYTGTGGTQIKGLLTYPAYSANAVWTQGTDKLLNVTASTVATDGNTLQPQDLNKLMGLLPDIVQESQKSILIYSPLAAALKARRADSVTAADQAGLFLLDPITPATANFPTYNNARFVQSYNVPSNRTKGSGTNLTIVVTGMFNDWIIARSGVVEFMADPYTNFASVQTRLRTIMYIDAGPRHIASFGYIDQLLPTT